MYKQYTSTSEQVQGSMFVIISSFPHSEEYDFLYPLFSGICEIINVLSEKENSKYSVKYYYSSDYNCLLSSSSSTLLNPPESIIFLNIFNNENLTRIILPLSKELI
jgi:hypothetical protein